MLKGWRRRRILSRHTIPDELWSTVVVDVPAIARLDADDREVLLLREYEQLSYAEIAELLAVPVGTVRSRLFRARMALKEMLT